jgi:ABC-type Na+ efflux pump permease subunit
MTCLPVVMRELRVASRRASTYWIRAGAALLFVLIGIWVFAVGHNEPPTQLAQISFAFLTGAAGVFCLLSGVRYTSDCLSEEKRQGTLGLLFLTDLSGFDVVAGKLTASSLHALHALLAILPLLAIPLLLGGVSGMQFVRVGLSALNLLFFSLAVGICASALHQAAKRASALTIMILLSITFLLPAAGGVLHAYNRITVNGLWVFMVPSPGFTFAASFVPLFTPVRFWSSFALVHCLAWGALLTASWIAPHSWQDRTPSEFRLRWRDRLQRWLQGDSAERARTRAEMLALSPYHWLISRKPMGAIIAWLIFGILTIAWLGLWAKFRSDWLNEAVYVGTALLLNVLLKGLVIGEVGRQVAEDRQAGTLELLLSTSLSISDLLRGQWHSLKRQFAGPALFVSSVFLLFAVLTYRQTFSVDARSVWLVFWPCLLAMLAADLTAAFWVGIADGLVHANPHRASSVTFTRILVIPWVLMGVLIFLLAVVPRTSNSDPQGGGFILAWFLIGLITDFVFGLRARRLILEDFRSIAQQPAGTRPALWRRLLGF